MSYGVNRFLNHALHRFNLFNILNTTATAALSGQSRLPDDKVGKIMDEFLLFLINLVTELPTPSDANVINRIESQVRREIVHKLATGPCTYSQLQEAISVLQDSDNDKTVVLDKIIKLVADCMESNGMDVPKFRLKESAWSEYDPSFPHISSKMHQVIMESRPKLKSSCPIVRPPLLSHVSFADVRTLVLFDSVTMHIVREILLMHMATRNIAPTLANYGYYTTYKMKYTHREIASGFNGALHIFTLMIHNTANNPTSESSATRFTIIPDLSRRKSILSHFFLQGIPLSTNQDIELSTLNFGTLLMDLYQYYCSSTADDPTKHWIMWCIEEMGKLSHECEELVRSRLSKEIDAKRALEMEERKKKARERAMKAMNSSAKAFAAHIGSENMKAMDEDLTEKDVEDNNDVKEELGDDSICILCRSNSTMEMLGLLCFSQVCHHFTLTHIICISSIYDLCNSCDRNQPC
jgi:hypothetical protein